MGEDINIKVKVDNSAALISLQELETKAGQMKDKVGEMQQSLDKQMPGYAEGMTTQYTQFQDNIDKMLQLRKSIETAANSFDAERLTSQFTRMFSTIQNVFNDFTDNFDLSKSITDSLSKFPEDAKNQMLSAFRRIQPTLIGELRKIGLQSARTVGQQTDETLIETFVHSKAYKDMVKDMGGDQAKDANNLRKFAQLSIPYAVVQYHRSKITDWSQETSGPTSFKEMLPKAFQSIKPYMKDAVIRQRGSSKDESAMLSEDELKSLTKIVMANSYALDSAVKEGVARKYNGKVFVNNYASREMINAMAGRVMRDIVNGAQGEARYGIENVEDPEIFYKIARKNNKMLTSGLSTARSMNDTFSWLNPGYYEERKPKFHTAGTYAGRITFDPRIDTRAYSEYTLEDMKAGAQFVGKPVVAEGEKARPEDYHQITLRDSILHRRLRATNAGDNVEHNGFSQNAIYLKLPEEAFDFRTSDERLSELKKDLAQRYREGYTVNGRHYSYTRSNSTHAEFVPDDIITELGNGDFNKGRATFLNGAAERYTDFVKFNKAKDYQNKTATDSQTLKDLYGTDFKGAVVVVADMKQLGMDGFNIISDKLVPASFQGRESEAAEKATYVKANIGGLFKLYEDKLDKNGNLVIPGAAPGGADLVIPPNVSMIEGMANIKNYDTVYAGKSLDEINAERSKVLQRGDLSAKVTYGGSATDSRWLSHQLVQTFGHSFGKKEKEYFQQVFFDELASLGDAEAVRRKLFNGEDVDLNSPAAMQTIQDYQNMLFTRQAQGDLLLPENGMRYGMAAPWLPNIFNAAFKQAKFELTPEQEAAAIDENNAVYMKLLADQLGIVRAPYTAEGNIKAKNEGLKGNIAKLVELLGFDPNGLYMTPGSASMRMMQTEDFDGDINGILNLSEQGVSNTDPRFARAVNSLFDKAIAYRQKYIDEKAGRTEEQQEAIKKAHTKETNIEENKEYGMFDPEDNAERDIEGAKAGAKMGAASAVSRNAWQYGPSARIAKAFKDASSHYDAVSTWLKERKDWDPTKEEWSVLGGGAPFLAIAKWANDALETTENGQEWTERSQQLFNNRDIDKVNLPSINQEDVLNAMYTRFTARARGWDVKGNLDWDQIFANLPEVDDNTATGRMTKLLRNVKRDIMQGEYVAISNELQGEINALANASYAEITREVEGDQNIPIADRQKEIERRYKETGGQVARNISTFVLTETDIRRNKDLQRELQQLQDISGGKDIYGHEYGIAIADTEETIKQNEAEIEKIDKTIQERKEQIQKYNKDIQDRTNGNVGRRFFTPEESLLFEVSYDKETAMRRLSRATEGSEESKDILPKYNEERRKRIADVYDRFNRGELIYKETVPGLGGQPSRHRYFIGNNGQVETIQLDDQTIQQMHEVEQLQQQNSEDEQRKLNMQKQIMLAADQTAGLYDYIRAQERVSSAQESARMFRSEMFSNIIKKAAEINETPEGESYYNQNMAKASRLEKLFNEIKESKDFSLLDENTQREINNLLSPDKGIVAETEKEFGLTTEVKSKRLLERFQKINRKSEGKDSQLEMRFDEYDKSLKKVEEYRDQLIKNILDPEITDKVKEELKKNLEETNANIDKVKQEINRTKNREQSISDEGKRRQLSQARISNMQEYLQAERYEAQSQQQLRQWNSRTLTDPVSRNLLQRYNTYDQFRLNAENAKIQIARENEKLEAAKFNYKLASENGDEHAQALAQGQIDSATASLEHYRAALDSANSGMKQFGKDGNFNKGMNTISASIEEASKAMDRLVQNFGRKMLRSAFQEAKNFTVQFDSQMRNIQAITMKTDEQMQAVKKATIDRAIELKTSVANVAQVEADLYRQGLNDQQVDERSEAILKFSTVTGAKITDAGKAITTAIQNDLVGSATEAMDVLTALGDNAATTANEIFKGMQKSAAAAKIAGVSYKELTTMLTIGTSKTQLSGQVLGTGLQTIFSRMNRVTNKGYVDNETGAATTINDVEKALSSAGIKLRAEDGKSFRNSFEVLRDLSSVWNTLSDLQRSNITYTMAGGRQQNIFQSLMEGMSEDNGSELARLLGLAENSSGSTENKYEIAIRSITASLEELRATYDGLVAAVDGNGFFIGALDTVTDFVGGLKNFVGTAPSVVTGFTIIGTAIAAFIVKLAASKALMDTMSGNAVGLISTLAGIAVAGTVLAGAGAIGTARQDWLNSNDENKQYEERIERAKEFYETQKKRIEPVESQVDNVEKLGEAWEKAGKKMDGSEATALQNALSGLEQTLSSLTGNFERNSAAIKDWRAVAEEGRKSAESIEYEAAERADNIADDYALKQANEMYEEYISKQKAVTQSFDVESFIGKLSTNSAENEELALIVNGIQKEDLAEKAEGYGFSNFSGTNQDLLSFILKSRVMQALVSGDFAKYNINGSSEEIKQIKEIYDAYKTTDDYNGALAGLGLDENKPNTNKKPWEIEATPIEDYKKYEKLFDEMVSYKDKYIDKDYGSEAYAENTKNFIKGSLRNSSILSRLFGGNAEVLNNIVEKELEGLTFKNLSGEQINNKIKDIRTGIYNQYNGKSKEWLDTIINPQNYDARISYITPEGKKITFGTNDLKENSSKAAELLAQEHYEQGNQQTELQANTSAVTSATGAIQDATTALGELKKDESPKTEEEPAETKVEVNIVTDKNGNIESVTTDSSEPNRTGNAFVAPKGSWKVAGTGTARPPHEDSGITSTGNLLEDMQNDLQRIKEARKKTAEIQQKIDEAQQQADEAQQHFDEVQQQIDDKFSIEQGIREALEIRKNNKAYGLLNGYNKLLSIAEEAGISKDELKEAGFNIDVMQNRRVDSTGFDALIDYIRSTARNKDEEEEEEASFWEPKESVMKELQKRYKEEDEEEDVSFFMPKEGVMKELQNKYKKEDVEEEVSFWNAKQSVAEELKRKAEEEAIARGDIQATGNQVEYEANEKFIKEFSKELNDMEEEASLWEPKESVAKELEGMAEESSFFVPTENVAREISQRAEAAVTALTEPLFTGLEALATGHQVAYGKPELEADTKEALAKIVETQENADAFIEKQEAHFDVAKEGVAQEIERKSDKGEEQNTSSKEGKGQTVSLEGFEYVPTDLKKLVGDAAANANKQDLTGLYTDMLNVANTVSTFEELNNKIGTGEDAKYYASLINSDEVLRKMFEDLSNGGKKYTWNDVLEQLQKGGLGVALSQLIPTVSSGAYNYNKQSAALAAFKNNTATSAQYDMIAQQYGIDRNTLMSNIDLYRSLEDQRLNLERGKLEQSASNYLDEMMKPFIKEVGEENLRDYYDNNRFETVWNRYLEKADDKERLQSLMQSYTAAGYEFKMDSNGKISAIYKGEPLKEEDALNPYAWNRSVSREQIRKDIESYLKTGDVTAGPEKDKRIEAMKSYSSALSEYINMTDDARNSLDGLRLLEQARLQYLEEEKTVIGSLANTMEQISKSNALDSFKAANDLLSQLTEMSNAGAAFNRLKGQMSSNQKTSEADWQTVANYLNLTPKQLQDYQSGKRQLSSLNVQFATSDELVNNSIAEYVQARVMEAAEASNMTYRPSELVLGKGAKGMVVPGKERMSFEEFVRAYPEDAKKLIEEYGAEYGASYENGQWTFADLSDEQYGIAETARMAEARYNMIKEMANSTDDYRKAYNLAKAAGGNFEAFEFRADKFGNFTTDEIKNLVGADEYLKLKDAGDTQGLLALLFNRAFGGEMSQYRLADTSRYIDMLLNGNVADLTNIFDQNSVLRDYIFQNVEGFERAYLDRVSGKQLEQYQIDALKSTRGYNELYELERNKVYRKGTAELASTLITGTDRERTQAIYEQGEERRKYEETSQAIGQILQDTEANNGLYWQKIQENGLLNDEQIKHYKEHVDELKDAQADIDKELSGIDEGLKAALATAFNLGNLDELAEPGHEEILAAVRKLLNVSGLELEVGENGVNIGRDNRSPWEILTSVADLGEYGAEKTIRDQQNKFVRAIMESSNIEEFESTFNKLFAGLSEDNIQKIIGTDWQTMLAEMMSGDYSWEEMQNKFTQSSRYAPFYKDLSFEKNYEKAQGYFGENFGYSSAVNQLSKEQIDEIINDDGLVNWIKNIDGGTEVLQELANAGKVSSETIKKFNANFASARIKDVKQWGDNTDEVAENVAKLRRNSKSANEALRGMATQMTSISKNQFYRDRYRKGDKSKETVNAISGMTGLSEDLVKQGGKLVDQMLKGSESDELKSVQTWADTVSQMINDELKGKISNLDLTLDQMQILATEGSVNIDFSDVANKVDADVRAQMQAMIAMLEQNGFKYHLQAEGDGESGTVKLVIDGLGSGRGGGGGGGGGGGKKKSKAEELLEKQKREQAQRSHEIKMIQYQETKYENAGELSNQNRMLQLENKAQERYVKTLQKNIAETKKQLAQTKKGTDDWKNLYDAILGYEEAIEEANIAIGENTKKIKENRQAIYKMRSELEQTVLTEIENRKQTERNMLEGSVSMQDIVLEAIRQRYRDEWELIEKDVEKKKEALEKEKDLIDERLQRRKDAEDEAEKYEELAEYKKQLALIEMDSTRTKDAAKLRAQIADLEKDISWGIAEDEANYQKETIDDQIQAYEDFITYGSEDLEDYLEDANNFADEVNEVMQKSQKGLIKWLKNNVKEYALSLDSTQKQMIQGWTDTYEQMLNITHTYWNEIAEILSGKNTFLKYMKASQEYKDASAAERKQMVYEWSEMYDNYIAAQKKNAVYSHSDSDINKLGQNTNKSSGGSGGGGSKTNNNKEQPKDTITFSVDEPKNQEDSDSAVSKATEAVANTVTDVFNTVGNLVGQALGKLNQTISAGIVNQAGVSGTEIVDRKTGKTISAFASGGLVDYTGPAWVDGTPTKPEAFLDAEDTALMRDWLDSARYVKYRSSVSNIDSSAFTGNSQNIGELIINITEAQFKDDADFDEVANKVGDRFVKELSKQGFNMLSYSF